LRADIDFRAPGRRRKTARSRKMAPDGRTGALTNLFNAKDFRFDVHGSNFDFAHPAALATAQKLAMKGSQIWRRRVRER